MTRSSVTIQITSESKPSTPSWMGEVAAFAQVLTHVGTLKAIQERVRFARARFGQYDLIDFVVVLIGYMLSGEPTLKAFYDCPAVPLTSAGPEVRLVVATHATTSASPTIGSERDGTVYELFISTLPSCIYCLGYARPLPASRIV